MISLLGNIDYEIAIFAAKDIVSVKPKRYDIYSRKVEDIFRMYCTRETVAIYKFGQNKI